MSDDIVRYDDPVTGTRTYVVSRRALIDGTWDELILGSEVVRRKMEEAYAPPMPDPNNEKERSC